MGVLMQSQSPNPEGGQRLLRSWVALAAGALGLSVLAAVVLVLARTPGLANPGLAALFAPALIMHVNLATLVWFLAFSVVLLSRIAGMRAGRLAWFALTLAMLGVAAVVVSPLVAPGPALLSNYFPRIDSPWFVGGLLVFLIGIALALVRMALHVAWRPDGVAGPLRALAGWVLLPFAATAVSLAATLSALPGEGTGLMHEVASWAPGHLIQFFFTASMMLAWVWLASALGWERAGWYRIAWPFAVTGLASLLALTIHLLYAPTTPEFRKAFTVVMALGTWPGPLLLLWRWRHGLARLRSDQTPVAAALRGSALLFVVGCLIGAAIRGDNTMVPAHYHGTVGAATLAFIGVATLMLKLDARGRRAALLVWLYGAGFSLMVASLAWSGWLGAPRKSAYTQAIAQETGYAAAMALHGVGGLLAVMAAALLAWTMLAALRPGATLSRLELAPPAEPPRAPGRDVRRRALAITLAGLIALGGLLALYGQGRDAKAELDRFLAWVPAIDRVSHVTERRRAEMAVRFAQGVAMLRANQFEHAVTAFHRVLALDPNMPEAHVNMGYAMLGLNRVDAARDFFEGATALNPMQGNAYYGLALALEARGDLAGATGAMRTYLHLAKGQSEAHLRRARAALWEWDAQRQANKGAAPKPGEAGAASQAARQP